MNDEVRVFIKDITLFLQDTANYTPEKIEPMFQRAYRLYTKYDVEKQITSTSTRSDERFQCGRCGGPIKHGKDGRLIPISRG